jgi:hypothetical protein
MAANIALDAGVVDGRQLNKKAAALRRQKRTFDRLKYHGCVDPSVAIPVDI